MTGDDLDALEAKWSQQFDGHEVCALVAEVRRLRDTLQRWRVEEKFGEYPHVDCCVRTGFCVAVAGKAFCEKHQSGEADDAAASCRVLLDALRVDVPRGTIAELSDRLLDEPFADDADVEGHGV